MNNILGDKLIKVYEEVLPLLSDSIFDIPIKQLEDRYFPDFLQDSLKSYSIYFENIIAPRITRTLDDSKPANSMLSSVIDLTTELTTTVKLFYEGKLLTATKKFNAALDKVEHNSIQSQAFLDINGYFYRARTASNRPFVKEDMFHVPFDLRHTVSTNRYSIPGLPALYLGSSAYVCWEEFDRYKFKNLYYSRFSNNRKLKVIRILRADDVINVLDSLDQATGFGYLLMHFILFPLSIACSICTVNPQAIFKPEYIIPQLLLQYVTNDQDLDGIMYPSTKLDYSKLDGITAYNYVFPVKEIIKKGFCPKLIETWKLTEPTSLELEELMFIPFSDITVIRDIGGQEKSDSRRLKLIDGLNRPYEDTSFGLIEERMSNRPLRIIEQS